VSERRRSSCCKPSPSIAIFVYFARSNVDKRPWNTFVAPLLGIAGLLPFLYYALTGMDLLLGAGGCCR